MKRQRGKEVKRQRGKEAGSGRVSLPFLTGRGNLAPTISPFHLFTFSLFYLFTFLPFCLFTPYACYADIQPGNEYVDVRKLAGRDAKNIGKTLTHPCELSDDVVVNVLSSIYFKEKGLLKKKTRQAVLTSIEVRTIAPLVAEAFSRATASEYIVVYSAIDRVLLSDLHTYCIMFVTEDGLNIAFTAIRQKLSYNVTESEKARIEKIFDKPLDIKKSAFWELVPVEGQRLKEGHQNWLLIDLKAVTTMGKPIAKKESASGGLPDTAYASEFEEDDESDWVPPSGEPSVRRRAPLPSKKRGTGGVSALGGLNQQEDKRPERLPEAEEEDSYIRVDIAKDYVPERPPYSTVEEREINELKNLDIKEKLKRLRVLRDEGLITEEDYRSKKAHIVKQEQKDKSIRERLKELREMRDEGLITEKDYDSLKKELLDKWF